MSTDNQVDLIQDYGNSESRQLEKESKFELPEDKHAQSEFYGEDQEFVVK